MPVEFFQSGPTTLDPVVFYAILALRCEVFVVEQAAAYPDLDGRDVEPGAQLLWAAEAGTVLATLRVLREVDGHRIGRVATARAARGRGLAAALMRSAVAQYGQQQLVLDAQEHLEHWYGAFGFIRSGAGYVEDNIPHIPMTRAAG